MTAHLECRNVCDICLQYVDIGGAASELEQLHGRALVAHQSEDNVIRLRALYKSNRKRSKLYDHGTA